MSDRHLEKIASVMQAQIGNWQCEACGEIMNNLNPSWRCTGDAYEHRCEGIHPQCGYMPAKKINLKKYISICRFWFFNGELIKDNKLITTFEGLKEFPLDERDSEPGDEYIIEVVEMTEAEYKNLDEFVGW